MKYEPSVAWLWGSVYACFDTNCWILTSCGWEKDQELVNKRMGCSSVVTSQGLLIVGGWNSKETTEVVSQTGSRSSFPLSSEMQEHCVIQTSSSSAVLIGGSYTPKQALEYTGLDGPDSEVKSTNLPDLITGRANLGCGTYRHQGTLVGSSNPCFVTDLTLFPRC